MSEKNISPILFTKKDDENKQLLNFDYFTSDKAVIPVEDISESTSTTKKRGRPPKKQQEDVSGVYVPADNGQSNLPIYQTNEPYINSYNETNGLLKQAIGQIDTLAVEIKSDIDSVRASKTLKNKYNYLTNMTETTSSLLGTKISAIRELNNSITQAHNLDLKKLKELNLNAKQDEQNDDRRIMDLYSAFINTPVSTGTGHMLGPSVQDTTLMGVNNIVRADTGITTSIDTGYNNYLNNMTPEQNRMRMESNPNIETVVVFNQDTGQRYFDVIDNTTGQSVPNYSRPDNFLLEDTNIDISRGIARNTQLDQTYKLIVVGSNPNITEY